MTERTYLDEGDEVLLKVKVFRANDEQALIEFVSMDGSFSIRVPVSELSRSTSSEATESTLPSAGWGCPDCRHNHSGQYVPDGQNPKLYDGRCLNDIFGVISCGCSRRRPEKRSR